jgi:4-alpha-glucanotransferase
LLHPTSLPGPYGIGDLGPEAERFVDFLQQAGSKVWQVLPLGPTGFGDSPYQCFSAFAGNPLLISPDLLARDGLLGPADLEAAQLPEGTVDFEEVIQVKNALLDLAWERFNAERHPSRADFEEFCEEQKSWLDDYALFMALKEEHGMQSWFAWPDEIRLRDEQAMQHWLERCADAVGRHAFRQWIFYSQWQSLRGRCHEAGIRVMGDIPIYVAADSADVWSHPELFQLNEQGRPAAVAGVPPDYFSATGQLWGNPLYRWDRMQASGFAWWKERVRATFALFDIVRIDHFRGFAAYWSVPGTETTAINGEWLPAPGMALFEALEKEFRKLPIVAENLGVITDDVEALRHRFGFPGMAILQFAFGNDPQGPSFRPHNYPREIVAYSGTHDNDTTVGWWTSEPGKDSVRTAADIEKERELALAYLRADGSEIHWSFIQSLMASVANLVLFPAQDLLGLGSEARMNLPGSMAHWWQWRLRSGQLNQEIAVRLRRFAEMYDR